METTDFGNFETLEVVAYQYSSKLLYMAFYILTCGLIKYIPNKIQILLFYKKGLLSKSSHLYITGFNNFSEIIHVETREIPVVKENDNIINQFGNVVRMFEIFKTRFIYNRIQDKFMRPIYPEHEMRQKIEIYKNFFETSEATVDINEDNEVMKNIYYGENTTDIPLPSIIEIMVTSFFTLENMYLIFVLVLWYFTDYKIYAFVLFAIATITLSVEIYKKISSNRQISEQTKKTIMPLINKLCIVENKIIKQKIDSKYLFPGDLIELIDCEKFFCDAVIIKGSLLVDESFLTGESIPIPKEANETIFNGTKIFNTVIGDKSSKKGQESEYCVGMVTKTGFDTSHGSLLKTIMFPKEITSDLLRYISFILKISCCIIFTVFILMSTYYILISKNIIKLYITRIHQNEQKKYRLILDIDGLTPFVLSFDLVTVLISPAFSAALKLGLMNSISRLKKLSIECMSVSAIDVAGLVDVAVFDKTGTLTESHVELHDTISTHSSYIMEIAKSACHNLQLINKGVSLDNLVGDPMDISMVKTTQSQFLDTNNIILRHDNEIIKIQIINRTTFNSERKRITVLVKYDENKKPFLVTKGSSETIEGLLKKVPNDFRENLKVFSLKGYRVLSVAYKESDGSMDETDMTFLGFILFSNPLKEETVSTIESLRSAEIPCIICTGDSILTTLSVARKLKITNNVIMPQINVSFMEKEGEEIIKEDEASCALNNTQTQEKRHSIQKHEGKRNALKKSGSLLGKKTLIPIDETDQSDPEYCEIKITANDVGSPLQWICTGGNDSELLSTTPLAIEGPCFKYMRETEPDLYKQVLKKCVIYARMSPEQKMILVNDLKHLEKDYFFTKKKCNRLSGKSIEEKIFNDDYKNYKSGSHDKLKVLYCGDGANDCGALNAATVGVSLSPHISICHFISRTGNIKAVKTIISEGRSALVTSMSAFRNVCETSILSYIIFTVLMLTGTFFSEYETMFHDLCLVLPLNIILSTFKPLDKLLNINKYRKSVVTLNGFLYVEVLNSLKFIFLSGFSTVFIWTYFMFFPDVCPCFDKTDSDSLLLDSPLMFHTKKSTIFFYVLSLQILLSCIFNCRGEPHRFSKYRNVAFISYVLFNSTLLLILTTASVGIFPRIADILDVCRLDLYGGMFVAFLLVFNIFSYIYLHKREKRKEKNELK
ncbi:putative cation-transporting ATPase 13A4 [Cucumispora dikerogammari]|nr:putative cation-transporting ATPase 13A4 [Cucumispora dikerogammari]